VEAGEPGREARNYNCNYTLHTQASVTSTPQIIPLIPIIPDTGDMGAEPYSRIAV
jgi:hypothetical protein